MIEWAKEQAANPWIAIGLYWLPLAFCAVFYFLRTCKNYVKDRKKRSEAERDTTKHYVPTDTLGDILGRALITIVPVANIVAGVFDLAPDVFEAFFKWLGRTFNQPLVPKRNKE